MRQPQTVLITGASSGIGSALARRFARDGARLILVARRKDRLDALADELRDHIVPGTPLVHDLAALGACERIVETLRVAGIRVDVLVNNAGQGEYGEFDSCDLETIDHMMRLNMLSLVRLTRLVIPQMIERRSGRILNIASTAAFQPTPYMGVYGATKWFVFSFSLSLWHELRSKGISVTCVCPGPVATEFFDRPSFARQKSAFLKPAQSAESLADVAYRAMIRGRAVVVPGFLNKIGAFARRIVPLRTITRVTARILRPAGGPYGPP